MTGLNCVAGRDQRPPVTGIRVKYRQSVARLTKPELSGSYRVRMLGILFECLHQGGKREHRPRSNHDDDRKQSELGKVVGLRAMQITFFEETRDTHAKRHCVFHIIRPSLSSSG